MVDLTVVMRGDYSPNRNAECKSNAGVEAVRLEGYGGRNQSLASTSDSGVRGFPKRK